jgi:hypothetical protein
MKYALYRLNIKFETDNFAIKKIMVILKIEKIYTVLHQKDIILCHVLVKIWLQSHALILMLLVCSNLLSEFI